MRGSQLGHSCPARLHSRSASLPLASTLARFQPDSPPHSRLPPLPLGPASLSLSFTPALSSGFHPVFHPAFDSLGSSGRHASVSLALHAGSLLRERRRGSLQRFVPQSIPSGPVVTAPPCLWPSALGIAYGNEGADPCSTLASAPPLLRFTAVRVARRLCRRPSVLCTSAATVCGWKVWYGNGLCMCWLCESVWRLRGQPAATGEASCGREVVWPL